MSKLVDAARGYLGVRWKHRGRSEFTGVDCAGLGVLAFSDCGVPVKDFLLYGRTPHNDGLVKHLTDNLGEPLLITTPLQDGDLIVMRFVREPHHIAIVASVMYGDTPALNIIHADGQAGRVLEQRLTPDMAARITHIFRKEIQ